MVTFSSLSGARNLYCVFYVLPIGPLIISKLLKTNFGDRFARLIGVCSQPKRTQKKFNRFTLFIVFIKFKHKSLGKTFQLVSLKQKRTPVVRKSY